MTALVGLSYCVGMDAVLEASSSLVEIVEIEPQTLWFQGRGGRDSYTVDEEVLASLSRRPAKKVLHGVGFPVGGTIPPSQAQLYPLNRMIAALKASWFSEHLSFNQAPAAGGPIGTGFLLPPRQTRAGAQAAIRAIRAVARRLPIPFAFETGVNYLRPREDELDDGAFAAAVANGANCGIVLDLHNIWTNEKNGRQPALEFVAQLPRDRVIEIHVAGGHEYEGFWIDAHSGAVPQEVLALMRRLILTFPNLGAVIFEIQRGYLETFGPRRAHEQLVVIHKIVNSRRSKPSGKPHRQVRRARAMVHENVRNLPSPTEWERVLGGLVVGRHEEGPLAAELMADPGVGVLRKLVGQFRGSMTVGCLPFSTRLMMMTLGVEEFQQLLEEFWALNPPSPFASAEAEAFAAFALKKAGSVPGLKELLAFERLTAQVKRTGKAGRVMFDRDPRPMMEALGEFRPPQLGEAGSYEVLVVPSVQEAEHASGPPTDAATVKWTSRTMAEIQIHH